METAKKIDATATGTARAPRIILPPYTPPSAEELKRRDRLFERARRFREKVGPLGFSVAELIRQDRETH